MYESSQWCVGADPKLADNVTDYAPFYSDPKCIGLVQNTVNTFLNRTNTGAPFAAHWTRASHSPYAAPLDLTCTGSSAFREHSRRQPRSDSEAAAQFVSARAHHLVARTVLLHPAVPVRPCPAPTLLQEKYPAVVHKGGRLPAQGACGIRRRRMELLCSYLISS